MPESFLTIVEVAESLQLSPQAVRAMIRSGELPAIQVGARHLWRVPESAFEAYVAQRLAATRELVEAERAHD